MWELEKKKGRPVYQEIMDLITEYIQTGKLLPGERLPAERKLADYFEVNRSTVVHALEELAAEGVLLRRQGSGTTVNDGKWGLFTRPMINWRQYLDEKTFRNASPYLDEIQRLLHQKNRQVIDAFTGDLPLSLVPQFDLPSISWKAFLKEDELQDDFGYVPLRKAILQMLQRVYGLSLQENELLVTSGGQQALFLLMQVLLQAGDAVAIEEPSFFYALSLFQVAGIRLYGVGLDSEGMRLSELEEAILKHKVKMVFLNPTFQNPTTQTMTLQRRKDLILLCQKYHIPIVEDDAFGLLSFSKEEITPLKKLDSENVIYIGSLSKILGSTTKIGWLSAPSAVLERVAVARKEMDFMLSIFPQVLATYAVQNPAFPEKLSLLNKELQEKMTLFLQILEAELPQVFTYTVPKGGYYLWLTIPGLKISLKEMYLLLEKGLCGMPSYLFGVKDFGLRLNVIRLNKEEMKEAVRILKESLAIWQKN